MTMPISDIADMATLRAEIDRLDRALIDLLAVRTRCIDQAIRIKSGNGLPARIEDRIKDVVQKVRVHACETGVPEMLAETLWREMMEFYIAREEQSLGR